MKQQIIQNSKSGKADFSALKFSRGKLVAQGAEAVLIRQGETVLKRRVKKGYRISEIDERIRKLRTRSEGKLLERAGKLIAVPRVLKVDDKTKEIEMEFISGEKLSEKLDAMKNWKEVCFEIGENIAKLHDAGIIHGDLTTSNMIWVGGKKIKKGAQIVRAVSRSAHLVDGDSLRSSARTAQSGVLYFIDFGLGFMNARTEDKAVDLYLIKEALEAKHFAKFEDYWKEVLRGYRKSSKEAAGVLKRLEKVEKRGRYKQSY